MCKMTFSGPQERLNLVRIWYNKIHRLSSGPYHNIQGLGWCFANRNHPSKCFGSKMTFIVFMAKEFKHCSIILLLIDVRKDIFFMF